MGLKTAFILLAAGGKATLGVVRFDVHPGVGGQSGDQVFAAKA